MPKVDDIIPFLPFFYDQYYSTSGEAVRRVIYL